MPDDALFPNPEPAPVPTPTASPEGLPDWQMKSLRKLLDDLGLVTMSERQSVVEELAGRSVASLRELTFAEANQVLDALVAKKKSGEGTASAWDSREGDTWIDRL
ncbi:hypothetical protein Q9R29_01175 [Rothia sp. ARF10]|nr:hypothetical protein [Rothia sp. ARF10]